MIKLKKEQEQKIAEIKDLMAQKNSASILECTNVFLQNEEIKQEVVKTFDGKLANFYWVMAQMFPENASDFRAMAQADLYEHYWNEKITPEEWNELTPAKQQEWMEQKDVHSQKRYASDVYSSAQFKLLCEQSNIPYQVFVSRNDMPCGSTVGPSVSASLGIPTVDIGEPMLSMHSIREMTAVKDHESMIKLVGSFYR